MTIIKWRDSFNTGVQQFDKEHGKIVELINAMFVALRDKGDKETVLQVCDEILSYTVTHFDNEEKAMQEVNFPHLEEHIAEHQRLKEQALEFKTTISEKFPKGSAELYRFLREWLINHIQDVDMKYGPALMDMEKAD